MTTEQKAKAYDEAIERASKLRVQNPFDTVSQMMEHVFPELCESKDERIRKTLINFFQDWHKNRSHCWGISVPEILAWLEKQGTSYTKRDVDDAYLKGISDAKNELEKQGEQKSQRMISAEAKEALYDKPACAWSEEDEHRVKDTIYFLETAKKHYASTVELDACIDWLKAIKDRYSWKPSSELDETSYQVGIKRVLENPESYGLTKYNWKPSGEQMEVLAWCKPLFADPKLKGILESLIEDLKKLREE